MTTFCVACGAPASVADRFCAACGRPFPPAAPPPPGPPPPPSYALPPQVGGYPGPVGYPVVPARGTNGYAIAALVFGLLPLCVVGAILAFAFGAKALSDIERTGEDGRGLAIAGMVLGAIWLVLFIGYVTLVVGIMRS